MCTISLEVNAPFNLRITASSKLRRLVPNFQVAMTLDKLLQELTKQNQNALRGCETRLAAVRITFVCLLARLDVLFQNIMSVGGAINRWEQLQLAFCCKIGCSQTKSPDLLT